MEMLEIGTQAPEFSLLDQDGTERTLKEFLGKWVVLYFYPRDNTPGCRVEAFMFRDTHKKLRKAGAVILGVSKDGVNSHAKFAKKCLLPFSLLSDESTEMIERYGAWQLIKFMGKRFMGTKRVTYLIDPEGKIAHVFEQVHPKYHAEEVLNRLLELQSE